MSDTKPPEESAFWRNHTLDAQSVYQAAQSQAEALGRSYVVPGSILLALLAETDLLDAVLDVSDVTQEELQSDVANTILDDAVVAQEIIFAKTIVGQAAAIAGSQGNRAVDAHDILMALLQAAPPSVVGVFANHGLSVDTVKQLTRRSQ